MGNPRSHRGGYTCQQVVRNAVKENVLSDPSVVKDADYIPFLTNRGKGWVAVHDEKVIGFAIVDLETRNIWALFMDPEWEGKGIGRILHEEMLD